MIADARQRDAAIDVNHSWIVQAPAGSGKTELLIQRMLALLAEVDHPKQILAITFTNKAAAEMRQRLIQALETAQEFTHAEDSHSAKTRKLAHRALLRHGNKLLRNPTLLSIQTIDSFNAALVRKMPWISRFGGSPDITEDADSLYQTAVENLLAHLENADRGSQQLQSLLRHLDNNVAVLQQMLIDMLRRRDQWLRHMAAGHELNRKGLQHGLEGLCSDHLQRLRDLWPDQLQDDLLACADFAAHNLVDSPIVNCRNLDTLPEAEFSDLPRWLGIADLLLTGTGELRKTVTKNNGFPAEKGSRPAKERMLELLEKLNSYPRFISGLADTRRFPLVGYSEEQWHILQNLIELLPMLVAELWLVFRGQGQADFAEIALKANQSLGAVDDPSDLLLKIDQNLQHILVDEFQDTSRLQYQLLNLLISGWTEGDGRTLFLVGDPMQSIYRFREAEVGLFLQSFRGRFGDSLFEIQPLQLKCNFRSQQGIVDWVNNCFSVIFPASIDETTGAVPLTEAEAVNPALDGDACRIISFIGRSDYEEARQVLKLVQQAQAEDPGQSIAILARGRNHLRKILPVLREQGILYQAQDIDQLGARPAALDIIHLTRALLHRADRLSWLAVLRAPWCGLTLDDLHTLAAQYPRRTIPSILSDELLSKQVSDDGQRRLSRIWPVLQRALHQRGRQPLRALIEGCWTALGGPACYHTEGLSDAKLVFALLEKLDQGGDLESFEKLSQDLDRLFSEPDSKADGKLQVMTIHRAKGLQFDTVILPGLGKTTGRPENSLLRWQEHPQHGLLLGPVTALGKQQKDPLYQLIAHLEAEKQDLEAVRLLYVATTRAIRRLHLLGHADETANGELKPAKGSLLEKLWPVVRADFIRLGKRCDEPESEFRPPLLRRLPTDWSIPLSQPLDLPIPQSSGSAAENTGGDTAVALFSGWENSVQRHIGTLVHLQLEHMSRVGIEYWTKTSDEIHDRRLRNSLRACGIAAADLDNCVKNVCTAINKTLASLRGRWILARHPEQACELPMTGLVHGKLVHAVIDRTFVDDGYRWIIDYKASSPGPNEPVESFIEREAEHYSEQLQVYVHLLRLKFTDFPIRAALYFPLFDGWYEFKN